MHRSLLDSSASLASSALSPAATEQHCAPPTWVWQRELEALCGRISRVRAEEANELRRSAEEAERTALRRIEEVERRVLRCQSDESEALQRFLSGWNGALDVRLERQSAQVAGLVQRMGEEAERMELARVEVAQCREEAQHACSGMLETCHARLEAFRAELQAVAQASADAALRAARQQIEAMKQEADLSTKRAVEADVRLQARLESLEVDGQAAAQRLADVTSQLSKLEQGKLRSIMEELQQQQLTAQDSLRHELAANHAVLQKEATKHRVSWQDELDSRHARLCQESEAKFESLSADSAAAREEAARSSMELLAQLEAQRRAADESATRLGLELRCTAEAAERATRRATTLEDDMATQLRHLEEWCSAKCVEEASVASSQLTERLRLSEARQEGVLQAAVKKAEALAADVVDTSSRLQLHSARIRDAAQSNAQTAVHLAQAQRNGPKHEWCISRCAHRLQYLNLTSEGLWLDSEEFSLGSLGPLVLRLYPHGLRGGDGHCAIALRLTPWARLGSAAAPSRVELSLGSRRQTAEQQQEKDSQEVVWLCEGLGALEEHTKGSESMDVQVEVHVPGGLDDAPTATRSPRTVLASSVAGSPAPYAAQTRPGTGMSALLGSPSSPAAASPARHGAAALAVQAGAPAMAAKPSSPGSTLLRGAAVSTNPFEVPQAVGSVASSVSFGSPQAGEEGGWELRRPRVHVAAPGAANPV